MDFIVSLRFLFFELIFSLLPISGIAQPYRQMLGIESRWHIVHYFVIYDSDEYYASADTIINGKNYKILQGFHYNGNSFLREDTVSRRVYYRQVAGYKANQDILLYDFSLTPGDSLPLYNPNSTLSDSAGYFVLDSIESTNLLDGPGRVFHLSQKLNGVKALWIEGIGSLNLVNTASELPNVMHHGELSCFFKNGQHIYESALSVSFNECNISTVGIEQSIDETFFFPYPNPTSSILNIQVAQNTLPLKCQLFDQLGKIALTKTFNYEGLNNIDLGSLENGLYFLQLESANSVKMALVVKN